MAKKKCSKVERKILTLQPPRQPVLQGDVLIHVFQDLRAVITELDARRRHGTEVQEWLEATGNTAAFEQWRTDRNKAAAPDVKMP